MCIRDSGYIAQWTITRNTTAAQGKVILYYAWERNTDLVAKTYIAELRVVDVPDVDGEIAQQYPTIPVSYTHLGATGSKSIHR